MGAGICFTLAFILNVAELDMGNRRLREIRENELWRQTGIVEESLVPTL